MLRNLIANKMSFFVCALRIPGVIFSMRYIYTFHVSVSWCNQIHHMISSWSCYLNICFLFPILNWLPSAWFHLGSLFLFYLLQKGMLCGKHCTWEVEGGESLQPDANRGKKRIHAVCLLPLNPHNSISDHFLGCTTSQSKVHTSINL